MSTQSHSESFVIRFFESFLQEKNIKWVLAAGLLILFGSSLMVVMPHWDVLAPTWKFSTILAYTSFIYLAGSWSYHKLVLRKTGTSLLALTVLMVPLSFMAWQWLWAAEQSFGGQLVAWTLLGMNAVIATVISRKTFLHFLRKPQPTFLTSYLLLSFAGAVAPMIRDAGNLPCWVASLVLWSVFSIGSVKVNRHIFWLTEELRAPRILGFFPIGLLGGQFLILFAAHFARTWSVQWLGLGAVMVAIPVLMTADTIARVFQERTGNIVRPIPWSIMLPMITGLVLCVLGVCLAGTGLAHGLPYAIVPAAALAACMMAVTARRTNHSVFVWAMLVGGVVAYNFSPIYFQSLARAAVVHGARAVRESRLPWAFYGLTYLPLIAASAGLAIYARRRNSELFARPLRQFCAGISLLLLAVSFGHVKALLPVAALMTVVFTVLTRLFQDRRLAFPAMAAFLAACVGTAPFIEAVWGMGPLFALRYLLPLVGMLLLLAASPILDRMILNVPLLETSEQRQLRWALSPSRTVSALATSGIAIMWLLRVGVPSGDAPQLVSVLIFGALFLNTLVHLRTWVTWLAYGFAGSELARYASESAMATQSVLTLSCWLLLGQWFAIYLLNRWSGSRVAHAWGEVNSRSAWTLLSLFTVLLALPEMVGQFLGTAASHSVLSRDILLTLWCVDAARTWFSHNAERGITVSPGLRKWQDGLQLVYSSVGCLMVYVALATALLHFCGREVVRWFPVVWTATAILSIGLLEACRRHCNKLEMIGAFARRHSLRVAMRPIEVAMYGVFLFCASIQLFVFSAPFRIAGFLALGGLLAAAFLKDRPRERMGALVLINWTVIFGCLQWCVPQADNVFELFQMDLGLAPWWIAALASLSLPLWSKGMGRANPDPLLSIQRTGLLIFSFGGLAVTLNASGIGFLAAILAAVAFVALIGTELWIACNSRNEMRVWVAEYIGVLGVAYFLWFDVISFGYGFSKFVILGTGVGFYVAGLIARRHPGSAILAKPFLKTGLWMPLATVAIGVSRHLARSGESGWLGMNSLAILLAAAFYFWQAVERRSKSFAVLSAVILNIALALLWRELRLNDPQFYMIPIGISVLALVEILKKEIPADWHDPIRYAGALTILVSPTFHIVSGSWLHLFTLMLASTAVLLVSIGLRIKALMYAGVAFLVADLIGMVVCGSIDHPSLLWLAGIAFGAAILTLGAICEHNREKLLQRMRAMSAQLEQWN